MFTLDQDVDGDTLLMLSTCGSIDQLVACGFKTVKQQMMLEKILASTCSSTAGSVGSSSGSTVSVAVSPQPPRKLKKKELNDLSPQDKTVYLMM